MVFRHRAASAYCEAQTLIRIECIDDLGELAGKKAESPITCNPERSLVAPPGDA